MAKRLGSGKAKRFDPGRDRNMQRAENRAQHAERLRNDQGSKSINNSDGTKRSAEKVVQRDIDARAKADTKSAPSKRDADAMRLMAAAQAHGKANRSEAMKKAWATRRRGGGSGRK